MFGLNQQVPYAGAVYIKNGDGSAALFISHLGGYQVPGRCPRCRLYCTPLAAGDNKQMFGVSQQVSRAGGCYLRRMLPKQVTAAVAQFPRCEPPSRLTLPSFTAR